MASPEERAQNRQLVDFAENRIHLPKPGEARHPKLLAGP